MVCRLCQSKWTMFVPMMDRLQATEDASVGIHRSLERSGHRSCLSSHVDVVPAALLTLPATSIIQLTRQIWRQIFPRRCSLRNNRPELDEISFSLYIR